MIDKASCSIEEVPYCFPRSSIKFQGHKGQKIDDLDQIWARLLGRSQLSNPSDLPCYELFWVWICLLTNQVGIHLPRQNGIPSCSWFSRILLNISGITDLTFSDVMAKWSVQCEQYGNCFLNRSGTPVLEVIFNKYLIFEFSTGNSFLLLGL